MLLCIVYATRLKEIFKRSFKALCFCGHEVDYTLLHARIKWLAQAQWIIALDSRAPRKTQTARAEAQVDCMRLTRGHEVAQLSANYL